MPTLLDYRRRVRSVKNTQQVTRAMKFVAAALLRRAQERVFGARPYAAEILRVLRSAAARMEQPMHPLLARRPEERLLVLVVSGDRSLCGAFNANVLRQALQFLDEHRRQTLELLPVGKKARGALSKRQYHFVAEYVDISARVEFRQAKEISARVAELYSASEVDAVVAIYNEFKNVMVQRLRVEKLLPIDPELIGGAPKEPTGREARAGTAAAAPRAASEGRLVDYIYEQPPEQIFQRLLPRYLESEIYRVLLESSAAEQAARMTAMEAATNNAGELIDQLTLQMNKIRQAAITKEIIEVVSGASAAGA